jgi:hypothetical protein
VCAQPALGLPTQLPGLPFAPLSHPAPLVLPVLMESELCARQELLQLLVAPLRVLFVLELPTQMLGLQCAHLSHPVPLVLPVLMEFELCASQEPLLLLAPLHALFALELPTQMLGLQCAYHVLMVLSALME